MRNIHTFISPPALSLFLSQKYVRTGTCSYTPATAQTHPFIRFCIIYFTSFFFIFVYFFLHLRVITVASTAYWTSSVIVFSCFRARSLRAYIIIMILILILIFFLSRRYDNVGAEHSIYMYINSTVARTPGFRVHAEQVPARREVRRGFETGRSACPRFLSLSLSLSHFRAFSRIYARVRVIRARCDRDNLLPVRQDRHRANLTATSVHCYAIGVSDSITQDAFLSHFPSAVSSSYFFRRCHLCDLHSSETPPPPPLKTVPVSFPEESERHALFPAGR